MMTNTSAVDASAPWWRVRVTAGEEVWIDGIRGHDEADAQCNAVSNWITDTPYQPCDRVKILGIDPEQD